MRANIFILRLLPTPVGLIQFIKDKRNERLSKLERILAEKIKALGAEPYYFGIYCLVRTREGRELAQSEIDLDYSSTGERSSCLLA